MVIAIDGPAGAGKSSMARGLAERLGFRFLDTGAMYRAVALAGLRRGDLADQDLGGMARSARIELREERVFLEGEDVSDAIRAPEIARGASIVAADRGVREALAGQQRAILAAGDWVAEGRDIGTVVAPGAEVKVFLTASPQERARRRAQESGGDVEGILAEILERDQRDSAREASPLRVAPGAVMLDTTGLSRHEVIERLAELAGEAGGPRGPAILDQP